MDEAEFAAALADLEDLSWNEYHQSLAEVEADRDADMAARRIGRLGGVLLKQQFAKKYEHDEKSEHSGAYTSYELFPPEEFERAARGEPWQYLTLKAIQTELAPEDPLLQEWSTYEFAVDAQEETGFFGYFARAARPYVCGDAEVRKKVDESIEAVRKSGVEVVTPEALVVTGGHSLGVYLVDHVPALEHAGPTLVAVFVVILYKLGTQRFCEWSNQLRTDSEEKRHP